jgi:hypothetical protein
LGVNDDAVLDFGNGFEMTLESIEGRIPGRGRFA